MKGIIFHPGTQHSFHLARELCKRKLLLKYISSVVIAEDSYLLKILPLNWTKFLKSSMITEVPQYLVSTFPYLDIITQLSQVIGYREQVLFLRNWIFQILILRKIRKADFLIGFDTSSWYAIKHSKKRNILFFLDVSIGHPLAKESIYSQLTSKYPLWANDIKPKSSYLIAIENKEQKSADWIVVPSSFVRRTYIENGIPPEKIIVNPFGTNITMFNPTPKKIESIIFLFFGGLTARKGLPFLLDVWEKGNFKNAQLLIAGFGKIPTSVNLPANVINLGVIEKGNRQALFDKAHVFVFPSFFEGLAQVQIEAAAAGLPVIGTFNSGAEDLIENNVDGFVIEAGDEIALKEKLQFFIDNPQMIEIMGRAARLKAEQFSWEAYGRRWEEIIKKNVNI